MPSFTFTPDPYNVTWDGVSCAEVTFGVNQAGSSNSYTAKAYQVFTESDSLTQDAGTANEYTYEWSRGDRFYLPTGSGTKLFATDKTMTATALGSTGVNVIVSSLPTATATIAYAWSLANASGKLLVAGRIDVKPPQAYDTPRSGLVFVTGATATSC